MSPIPPYSPAGGDVVDGAPVALDTLNEIAAAIGDDPNFAATVAAAIAGNAALVETVSDDFRPVVEAPMSFADGQSAILSFNGILALPTITNPSATESMEVIVRAFSPMLRIQAQDAVDAPIHGTPFGVRRTGNLKDGTNFANEFDGTAEIHETDANLNTHAEVGALNATYHRTLAPAATLDMTFQDTLVVQFDTGLIDHLEVTTLSQFAGPTVRIDAIGVIIP